MEGNESINNDDPAVMDVKSASDYLKISDAKLRRLVTEKRIPYFRLDGRILFSRTSLEQWIQTLIVQPVIEKQDVAATIWAKTHGGK